MKSFLVALPFWAAISSAFPALFSSSEYAADPEILAGLAKRLGVPKKGVPLPTSTTNCGPVPCLTFDAKTQYVNVEPGTEHEFIAPGIGDIRGPCPGLNAAANHGFLPHNGQPTIAQTTFGLPEAFGIGADLAGFLGVLGVIVAGDPLTEQWSIGGPFPGSLLNKLGGGAEGISYSHNKYEGDASPARDDAYQNNGNAYSLIMEKFERKPDPLGITLRAISCNADRILDMYNLAEYYTTDTMYEQFRYNIHRSITTNPYYFSAPFSGLLAAPVAHYFIVNLMSNHSAENKGGWLDRSMLKTFFSVEGEPGSFKWIKGHERIPHNWYRRPRLSPYDSFAALADIQTGYIKHPYLFRLGGNLGKNKTFTGISLTDLTGGAFDAENIFKDHYIGCLAFQTVQIETPTYLHNVMKDVAPAMDLLNKYLEPILTSMNCPKLDKYDQGLFNQFPGYHYHPKAAKNSK